MVVAVELVIVALVMVVFGRIPDPEITLPIVIADVFEIVIVNVLVPEVVLAVAVRFEVVT